MQRLAPKLRQAWIAGEAYRNEIRKDTHLFTQTNLRSAYTLCVLQCSCLMMQCIIEDVNRCMHTVWGCMHGLNMVLCQQQR